MILTAGAFQLARQSNHEAHDQQAVKSFQEPSDCFTLNYEQTIKDDQKSEGSLGHEGDTYNQTNRQQELGEKKIMQREKQPPKIKQKNSLKYSQRGDVSASMWQEQAAIEKRWVYIRK